MLNLKSIVPLFSVGGSTVVVVDTAVVDDPAGAVVVPAVVAPDP
jgi:hypothetical protein